MHLDLSHEGLAVSASHRTEWKAADTSLESGLHLLYKASGRPSYTSNHLLRLAAVFRDGHKGDTFLKQAVGNSDRSFGGRSTNCAAGE